MTTNTDVYATDFFAWCLTTAHYVRTCQWDEIDPEALAEELESLGRSQKRELENRLEVLVMHLLKWQAQPLLRETGHSWYDTILEQRSQLHRLLRDNPSLRPQVPDLLPEVYPTARQRALGQIEPPVQALGRFAPQGTIGGPAVFSQALPLRCPWTDIEILNTDFWPSP